MKTARKIALLVAMLGLVTMSMACKSELDNKPAAKVEPAGQPTAAQPEADKATEETPKDEKAAAPAGEPARPEGALAVDKASSKIQFVGAKVTRDHTGTFEDFDGYLTLADGKPASLSFTVQVASVKTDSSRLDGHLRSPDFFDAANFPTASFASSAIKEEAGAGGATHSITGELEIRGVKKTVTFPATVSGTAGKAEFTIDRKDFNVVYPGSPDDLIKDEVLLKLDLSFVKA